MSSQDATADLPLMRVKRTSRWLKHLTTAGLIGCVGFGLAILAVPAWFDSMVMLANPQLNVAAGITSIKRDLLRVVYCLPLVVTLAGLWNVRMLFDCYARGEVFSPTPAVFIRNIGLVMLASVGVSLLMPVVVSLLLTYDNPVGSRQLSVSLSSNVYMLALLGGLFLVIGWVMREAARLSEENSRFV